MTRRLLRVSALAGALGFLQVYIAVWTEQTTGPIANSAMWTFFLALLIAAIAYLSSE